MKRGRSLTALILLISASVPLEAQAPPQAGGQPSQAAQAARPPSPETSALQAAPVDFTGYWVSVISEDWRWRMITPPKGDYANIPVNAEARQIGDTWDPAKDEASGERCKAYAAPAIMREPGRLHITWQDENTLKIETDAGTQTRLFHFGASTLPPAQGRPDRGGGAAGSGPSRAQSRDAEVSSPSGPSWQGHSVARWEQPIKGTTSTVGLGLGLAPRAGAQGRALEVVTTQIRPGYLRKNGVPFSANAVVNEYFDRFDEPDGTAWFVVTTVVQDPQYLNGPWVTTSHFKREADGSKWSPTPCSVR